MRNRAKCKLCNDIIESLSRTNYVSCRCGEIAVDGGTEYYRVAYHNAENFLRVDDEGNEITVKIEEKNPAPVEKPNKEELIAMLEEMAKNIENLPPHAMSAAISHYDLWSVLTLLTAILRAD